MAKVSVIVPVYNSENYLIDCLNSLINQSLDDIEIILVDDCSLDNSLSILKAYEKQYPDKIKVIHNNENHGQGYSRNVGLEIVTGEYITFVDSDDYIHPNMYEDMYNGALENGLPEVITTGLTFVKDNSYLNKDLSFVGRRKGRLFETLKSPEEIVSQSPACWNKMFRKDTLSNMTFLEGRMWEDVAFTYTQLFNSNNILVFNNKDYFYRKSADHGVSARGFVLNPDLLDCFAVADELEERTKQSNRFDIFSNDIKMVQTSVCLQRASEVFNWDISNSSKEKICFCLCKLVNEKYGNWQDLDLNLLSSKIGFMTIDKLKDIELMYNSVDFSSYEEEVNQELELLTNNINSRKCI